MSSCTEHSRAEIHRARSALSLLWMALFNVMQAVVGCSPLGAGSSRYQLLAMSRQPCCQSQPTQNDSGEACIGHTDH